jgi:phosphoribosylanthranilate isomerase
VTHSWELDRRIIESARIRAIIAGGLGPENVQDAIRVGRPAGVDSKTKTDKDDGTHTKDLQKVSAFLKAARCSKLCDHLAPVLSREKAVD